MNVGIVGCGRVTGLRHLPALRAVDGARVVALADDHPGRAEALAREHGVERSYEDAAELVADDAVEAVAVCVPAAAHGEAAILALDAGKHVLIEKPLCLRLDDAARLQEASARTEATTMVAFNPPLAPPRSARAPAARASSGSWTRSGRRSRATATKGSTFSSAAASEATWASAPAASRAP